MSRQSLSNNLRSGQYGRWSNNSLSVKTKSQTFFLSAMWDYDHARNFDDFDAARFLLGYEFEKILYCNFPCLVTLQVVKMHCSTNIGVSEAGLDTIIFYVGHFGTVDVSKC